MIGLAPYHGQEKLFQKGKIQVPVTVRTKNRLYYILVQPFDSVESLLIFFLKLAI